MTQLQIQNQMYCTNFEVINQCPLIDRLIQLSLIEKEWWFTAPPSGWTNRLWKVSSCMPHRVKSFLSHFSKTPPFRKPSLLFPSTLNGVLMEWTMPTPWTGPLIRGPLCWRGGRGSANKWLSHSVITGHHCLRWAFMTCYATKPPSPHEECWMTALPWLSLASFAPRKGGEEEEERGVGGSRRGRDRERAVNGTIT